MPSSPIPAQIEVSKPVYNHIDDYVGRVKAHPSSMVEEVIEELQRRLSIRGVIRPDPRNAVTWDQVDRLQFPERNSYSPHAPPPLANNIWDQFQNMRLIPIMRDGKLGTHMVMPSSLSLHEAQYRAEQWAGWRFTFLMVALGPYIGSCASHTYPRMSLPLQQ